MNYNQIVALVYEAKKFVFSSELKTQVKNGNPNDFVTIVDTSISDFIKTELAKAFPSVGFMTEEEKTHTLGDKSFILDPIDGTTNLVYDYKMSSISLAYQENGSVKFGVVFNPFAEELFFAIKGKGAHYYRTNKGIDALIEKGVENYTGGLLKASTRPLEKSIIEFGATVSNKSYADKTFERAKLIFKNCLDLRRTCSTALAICYIAAGRLDGYFEQVIKPWDYAAAILILAEAGGKSSDWQGNELPLDKSGTIICANATIHQDLKKLVNE